jgi:hypothetical protein
MSCVKRGMRCWMIGATLASYSSIILFEVWLVPLPDRASSLQVAPPGMSLSGQQRQ